MWDEGFFWKDSINFLEIWMIFWFLYLKDLCFKICYFYKLFILSLFFLFFCNFDCVFGSVWYVWKFLNMGVIFSILVYIRKFRVMSL